MALIKTGGVANYNDFTTLAPYVSLYGVGRRLKFAMNDLSVAKYLAMRSLNIVRS